MPDTAGLGELWVAVSRLCERYEVRVAVIGRPPGWEVVLAPRGDGQLISGTAEHLVDAMSLAVKRAHVRGLV